MLKTAVRQPYLLHCMRRRRLVKPLFLRYAVTWRCNARCVMCDIWKVNTPDSTHQELTVDQMARIIERDREFLSDLSEIGLTGGEPFLRSDLVELVRLLHASFPQARVSLVSNGQLTGRILTCLEQIREFFPELVFSVSLDGIGEAHDRARGLPGAYDKAMTTLKGALKLGFTVTSGMTIGSHNYDQIMPLSRQLSEMGIDFSCNMQERGANFNNSGRAEDLAPSQLAGVTRALEEFPHHFYMDNLRSLISGGKRSLPCFAGYTSYFLNPNGDVSLCNLISRSIGNLREMPFRTLSDADAAWKLRNELSSCTCWSQCEVKSSAASAPWHIARWFLKSRHKRKILRQYLGKK
jgi:MoaA/NifB/PqqE/SkfB family radical SAM enzyme